MAPATEEALRFIVKSLNNRQQQEYDDISKNIAILTDMCFNHPIAYQLLEHIFNKHAPPLQISTLLSMIIVLIEENERLKSECIKLSTNSPVVLAVDKNYTLD